MCRPITYMWYIIGLVLTIIGIAVVATVKPWLTPEQILERFQLTASAEDMLMDPLILGGGKVVPLVVREIQKRDMFRRRYAIGFLGNGAYVEAVPVLEKIIEDETEEIFIRVDSLLAIYQIDQSIGTEKAKRYEGRRGGLGEMAQQIILLTPITRNRRSYFQALFGKHY